MNRRSFLGWIAFTPLAAKPLPQWLEAAAAAVPVLAVPTASTWLPVAWYRKEFDFGNFLGIALEVRNAATGEKRRNAVRMRMSEAIIDRRHEEQAHHLLTMWAEEGATIIGPGGGVAGDDVLEGREMELPPEQPSVDVKNCASAAHI